MQFKELYKKNWNLTLLNSEWDEGIFFFPNFFSNFFF